MKYIVPPIIAYVVVCIIAILLPGSQCYDTSYKLAIGQIYAVPTLIVVALVSYYLNKKRE